MSQLRQATPFNSPLETGVRALVLLVDGYPQALDLQRLVEFDYFLVHSGDVEGPPSLHAPVPYRTGELLVRRDIVTAGLMLFIARGLIEQIPTPSGINYVAGEASASFLASLTTEYIRKLQERAKWVTATFGHASAEEIRTVTSRVLRGRTTHSGSPDFIQGAM